MKQMEEAWFCFIEEANFHIDKLNYQIVMSCLGKARSYYIAAVGVEKIKLSHLLVQHINEFKMKEIQRKTSQ